MISHLDIIPMEYDYDYCKLYEQAVYEAESYVVLESSIEIKDYTGIKVFDVIISLIAKVIEVIKRRLRQFAQWVSRLFDKAHKKVKENNNVVYTEMRSKEKQRAKLQKNLKNETDPAKCRKIEEELEKVEEDLERLREKFRENNKGVLISAKHYQFLTDGDTALKTSYSCLTKNWRNFNQILTEHDDLIKGIDRVGVELDNEYAAAFATQAGSSSAEKIASRVGTAAANGAKSTFGKHQRIGRDDVAEDDEERLELVGALRDMKSAAFTPGGVDFVVINQNLEAGNSAIADIANDRAADPRPSSLNGKYISDSYISELQTIKKEYEKKLTEAKNSLEKYQRLMTERRKMYLDKKDAPNEEIYNQMNPGKWAKVGAVAGRPFTKHTWTKAPDYMVEVINLHSSFVDYYTKVSVARVELSATVLDIKVEQTVS